MCVKFQSNIMSKVTTVMMGQKDLGWWNTLVCKFVVDSFKFLLTHPSSQAYNFSFGYHMKLTFHTQLDTSCIYYVGKYYIAGCHHS